jgi:hypothetical protein
MTARTFTEVAPPARTPSRDDLLATLEREGVLRTDVENERWVAGIQFRPENLGGGGIFTDNCLANNDLSSEEVATCTHKVFNTFKDAVEWRGYTMFSSVSCSTFSDRADITAEARRQFAFSRGAIAAFELYYGLSNRIETLNKLDDQGNPYPVNPYLATTVQDFPTATAAWTDATILDPIAGLATIHQEISARALGTPSVIHASPALTVIWEAMELIRRADNGNFYTNVGEHLVLAPPGYYGSTPLDPTDPVPSHSPGVTHPGVHWTYVTGPLVYYEGEYEVSDTLQQRRNNYFTVAEQNILVAFDDAFPRFALPIGRDCTSLDVDFTVGGDPVNRIMNDQYLACVTVGSGEDQGEAIDPEAFIGLDYGTDAADGGAASGFSPGFGGGF